MCRTWPRRLAAPLLVTLLLGTPGARRASAQLAAPGDHGTPPGWTLRWPAGDPRKGREAFARFECYSCHEVRGETFPPASQRESLGPELSVMGPLHAPVYFVEAIVDPSAVIERGKGYEAADGSSRMPSYNDTLTVQELIDLVAYLHALRPPVTGPGGAGGDHGAHH